jgi:hypothetical protein
MLIRAVAAGRAIQRQWSATHGVGGTRRYHLPLLPLIASGGFGLP